MLEIKFEESTNQLQYQRKALVFQHATNGQLQLW